MADAGFTHESTSAQSVDWYTPEWIFKELGLQFDLDPCQPIGGVPWIPATAHFDERWDGLLLPWWGASMAKPPIWCGHIQVAGSYA